MSFERLQIKQLSPSGEVLKCINCAAARVTVLRGYSPQDLLPFRRALAGITGAEKFSLTLDNAPFNPAEHILIGFGESFATDSRTVEEYLVQSGVTAHALSGLLISYGLDNCSAQALSTLNPCESQRLKLLGALHSDDAVLLLNNPFELISSEWKERFAELVTTYTRLNNLLVVVPSLSYRPECWIDNETVHRVQVGENLQRTIGFAESSADVNAMLEQIRAEYSGGGELKGKEVFKAPEAIEQEEPPVEDKNLIAKEKTEFPEEKKDFGSSFALFAAQATEALSNLRGRSFLMLGLTLVVIVQAFLLFSGKEVPQTATQEIQVTRNIQPEREGKQEVDATARKTKADKLLQSIREHPRERERQRPSTLPSAEKPQQQFVLALYPTQIQRAITNAFESFREPGRSPVESTAKQREKEKEGIDRRTASLLSSLQNASGSGEGLPDRPSSPSGISASPNRERLSNLDPDKRRELIRQKFLEAIERARERRESGG